MKMKTLTIFTVNLLALLFLLPIDTLAQGQIAFISDREGTQVVFISGPTDSITTRVTNRDEQDSISSNTKWIAMAIQKSAAWSTWDLRLINLTTLTSRVVKTLTPTNPKPAMASPSLDRIIFAAEGTHLYMMDREGNNVTQITFGPTYDTAPAFHPKRGIVYESWPGIFNRNGEIFVTNIDGSNVINLTNHPAIDQNPSWSPDGSQITFGSNRDGNREIYAMDSDGRNVRRLTNHPAQDWDPVWSPDGSKIAFVSNRDGNPEIYVINSSDGSGPRNITNHPARDYSPIWTTAQTARVSTPPTLLTTWGSIRR